MKLVLSKTRAIDFRVSTLPTLYGEKIVLRILDSAGVKLGIEALGYDADQQEALLHAIGRPYGMILVTGPTGSRQDGVAVHLPQHPEPARHQHLDRRGPGRNPARRASTRSTSTTRPGCTFAVRAALVPAPGSGHHHGRRDPRPRDRRHRDQGRADRPPGALDAAHQRRADDADAPAQHGRRAVQRRIVGDPDHRAAARRAGCARTARSPRTSRREALLRAGFTEEDLDGTWQPFGAVGCDHCKGTGYKGRVGIYEVMPISDEMRQLIMRNGNAIDIARPGAEGRRARPAPVGPAQGQGRHDVARGNRGGHQRVAHDRNRQQ